MDVTGGTQTTAYAVGAHAGHLLNPVYRSATISCTECHAVPANGDQSHATGAGTNGARATLTWGNLARGTGWSTVVPTYTLSTTGAQTPTSTGSCNNYCHGNFKNGVNGTISWTAVGSLTCNSCHLSPPNGTHPANTNCASCHGTGYGQASVTGEALATHVDGTVQLGAMSCSSCHGDAAGRRWRRRRRWIRWGPTS